MKTVVIADDNLAFRVALKGVLTGFEIVGEAACGGSALELVKQKKPDLVILDLSMPRRTGMSIIGDIKLCHSGIKILVVTIHKSNEYARTVLDAGANGYFLKDEGRGALLSAISCVMEGGKYISPFLGRD
jgi:DNA-binding NarL/FixJ family response regulator